MPDWLPKDEQIVKYVRRMQAWRRPLGVSFAILGIVGAALVFHFLNSLRVRSIESLSQLSAMTRPTTQDLERSLDEARFNGGFAIGFILASGLAGACSIAVSGVVLLAPNRKDRLLLKCWGALQPSRSADAGV